MCWFPHVKTKGPAEEAEEALYDRVIAVWQDHSTPCPVRKEAGELIVRYLESNRASSAFWQRAVPTTVVDCTKSHSDVDELGRVHVWPHGEDGCVNDPLVQALEIRFLHG